jgi:hypothetical protein
MAIWVKNHPDKSKEYYRKKNPPHKRKRKKLFTSEELKQHRREYLNRPEVRQHNRERKKQWILNNPEEWRTRKKKQDFKRRGLGNNYLNKRFEGSHGHHVNYNDVIFIPESIHASIFHSVWSGEGMTDINDKVRQWLTEQNTPIQFDYVYINDPILTVRKYGRPLKENPKCGTKKQKYMQERYQRKKCGTIYPLAIYRDIRVIQPIS